MDSTYAAGSANRSLLVLGDGQPNDNANDNLETTCEKAQQTGVPINTIGFGPAADQSPNANKAAVDTLRNLANCSGGAYTGVVSATALDSAFANFGTAARSGSVVNTVNFDPIPAPQTLITGSVLVGNGAQAPVSVTYTFVAP